ncbi:MAG: tripartite tricarboxylate transporter substrate binding protein [Methylobacteriaceae bacterium]|nr:tripartite tricarboxylate transporter substrate binding protein [Methylobacteriaceae bacterium]
MFNRRQILAGASGAAAAALAPRGAFAQAFPAKPISMIVAFHAGGGTDIAARSIARYMEKYLGGGASIGVVNRPGGGGETGWTQVAQAAPDGYTIGFINAPAFISLMVEKQPKYSLDSFSPIGGLVYDPMILAVRKESEFKTIADVVKFAKEKPGQLSIGTTGASGNSEHLGMLQVERATGAKFNFVHFGSTAPMQQALLGGHLPVGTIGLSEGIALHRAGTLRILGAFSESRYPFAPDVPTVKEQGIEALSGSSRGIAGPAGIPAPILKQLQDALKSAAADPEYVENAKKADIPLRYMAPDEYLAWMRKTHADLKEIWAATPWKT